MSLGHVLTDLDAAGARLAAAGWVDIYNACFTAPPWSEPQQAVGEYLDAKRAHFAQPGLRAVEARDANGSLVGVSYGWPSSEDLPAIPFYQGLRAGLGPRAWNALWAAKPFEVVELMVHPAARGRGLGRLLLDRLCGSAQIAFLATHPDAPAVAIYRHLGWRRFGQFQVDTQYSPNRITLDAYVLDRRGAAAAVDGLAVR